MKQKRAIDMQSLFFYVFFSLPLFYIFDHPVISRTIRFSVLFGLLLLMFCVHTARQAFWRNLQGLGRFAKIALGVFLALVLLSTIFAQGGWRAALFGINPEYLGLVSWLSFLGLGILFYDRLGTLLARRTTLVLSLVIILLSLIGSYYEIPRGIRVSGLILQATTMGMYAVMAGVIGFMQLRRATTKSHTILSTLLIILSGATVLLTQSRIAVAAFVVVQGVLALYAVLGRPRRPHLALLATAMFVTVAFVPHLSASYFARFQADSVGNGVNYRLELYKLTAKDILSDNILLGNGPSSLPQSINNESAVPEDIQLSLRVGDVFLSSHNLYLDIGYCFGLVASLAVLVLTGYALCRPGTMFELRILFAVMVLNALLNVPSLELTPWYFVLLIALIGPRRNKQGQ